MGKIQALSADLINKIAAGEVVESAHSVLKELIENAVDAGADEISIETQTGGMEKILIRDNGSGILEEDLPLVVQRHATSKIHNLEDLDSLMSYGFRGEAVASIASIAKLTLESGTQGERFAHKIYVEQGEILNQEKIPHFQGTKIEIRDLFYNTPVRRKFSKSPESEDRKNKVRIQISALMRPNITFRYIQNGKEIYRIPGTNLKERIVDLFGENIRDHLLPIDHENNGFHVTGFISDPDFYRSNRMGQFFFVNNRPIEVKQATYLLKKCYDELLPPGSHPWCFLFFQIPPDRIDVNVHPQKKEIRFLEEQFFHSFFISALQKELRSSTPVSFLELKRRLSQPIRSSSFPGLGNSHSSSESGGSGIHPDSGQSGGGFPSSSSGDSPFQDILHRDIYPQAMKREPFDMNQTGPGINLHELNDQPSKHSEFIPKRHFGVIFETFILAEAEDGLYIIDQHTAHERIRYEEVLNRLESRKFEIQPLLTPIRMDLSRDEADDILRHKDGLKEMGIELEEFGEGTILIREVPGYLLPGQEREIIMDFLNRVISPDVSEPEFYDLMAKTVACRSSIRKGSQVSDAILSEILNRLSYTKNPSRCPHGRPTLVKLTRDDLEKMFHRK